MTNQSADGNGLQRTTTDDSHKREGMNNSNECSSPAGNITITDHGSKDSDTNEEPHQQEIATPHGDSRSPSIQTAVLHALPERVKRSWHLSVNNRFRVPPEGDQEEHESVAPDNGAKSRDDKTTTKRWSRDATIQEEILKDTELLEINLHDNFVSSGDIMSDCEKICESYGVVCHPALIRSWQNQCAIQQMTPISVDVPCETDESGDSGHETSHGGNRCRRSGSMISSVSNDVLSRTSTKTFCDQNGGYNRGDSMVSAYGISSIIDHKASPDVVSSTDRRFLSMKGMKVDTPNLYILCRLLNHYAADSANRRATSPLATGVEASATGAASTVSVKPHSSRMGRVPFTQATREVEGDHDESSGVSKNGSGPIDFSESVTCCLRVLCIVDCALTFDQVRRLCAAVGKSTVETFSLDWNFLGDCGAEIQIDTDNRGNINEEQKERRGGKNLVEGGYSSLYRQAVSQLWRSRPNSKQNWIRDRLLWDLRRNIEATDNLSPSQAFSRLTSKQLDPNCTTQEPERVGFYAFYRSEADVFSTSTATTLKP
eukprot:GHVQ01013084.1.p1 GENE.GHVQ01013084.1~~GHVQ01013084.1.p1  ORF type:complete len:543 (-),score=53.02 GHVQ01013084.1:1734-3362(-)